MCVNRNSGLLNGNGDETFVVFVVVVMILFLESSVMPRRMVSNTDSPVVDCCFFFVLLHLSSAISFGLIWSYFWRGREMKDI